MGENRLGTFFFGWLPTHCSLFLKAVPVLTQAIQKPRVPASLGERSAEALGLLSPDEEGRALKEKKS